MKLITKIIVAYARRADLSMEDRSALATVILDRLGALPFRDIIQVGSNGVLTIDGRPLDMETARKMRDSAKYVLESTARHFVREQVAFRAVTLGVHNGDTAEKAIFARAALWYGQQEDELYRMLAQEQ